MSRERLLLVLGLALALDIVLQVVPYSFTYSPLPLPPDFPPEFVSGFHAAEQYVWPETWASWFRPIGDMLCLLLILFAAPAVRLERAYGQGPWRWPMRILFLLGMFFCVYLPGLPYEIRSIYHSRSYGLTHLSLPAYYRIELLYAPVSLSTYLFKYILVFCCMALFRKRWWLGASVLVLLLFHVIPLRFSRTVPLDPVEKLTPLEDADFRAAMDQVAERAGMQLNYFVVDQSERSRAVNMYLTGRPGREYVVLTDNVLRFLKPAECAAILAHEFGHNVTRHITVPLGKAITLVNLLLIFLIVHWTFGRGAIPPDLRLQALVSVMLYSQVVAQPLYVLGCAISRYREKNADLYALTLIREADPLRNALLKTSVLNLEPYDVPGWVYYTGNTHPTVKQRLEWMNAWEARREGQPEP